MSMNQTTASGERLTLICDSGDQTVTQKQADSWLRQRQAVATRKNHTMSALAS